MDVRIFFLILTTLAGYSVSQVRPDLIATGGLGLMVGFGFGGLLGELVFAEGEFLAAGGERPVQLLQLLAVFRQASLDQARLGDALAAL